MDVQEAARLVRRGGVVAFPTDTVYGLGVNALDEAAIRRAFQVKRRPADTPMPVLLSDISQVERLSRHLDKRAHTLAERFWPGALTIVVAASDHVPRILTGGLSTVGLRVPNLAVAREFIAAAGCPVTGTSANISGEEPTKDWRSVAGGIGDAIDGVLVGECGDASSSSTVVDLSGETVKILRAGPVTREEIACVLDDRVAAAVE